jgi:hypothetical protein
MTTTQPAARMSRADPEFVERQHAERRHWGGPIVGGFYVTMGGVHLGIVADDPETYRHFADGALFAFISDAWQDIFMPHAAVFGLLLMAGEITLGTLLLIGGRCAKIGWIGVIAFHVALMLFGFGTWLWCIPALVVLVLLARRDNSVSWAQEPRSSTETEKVHR